MENTPVDYSKMTQEELIAAMKAKDTESAAKDAQALEVIKNLKNEVLKKKDAVAKPTVEVAGKIYQIIVAEPKIVVNGASIAYTAENLAQDQELCEDLIERGSDIFQLKKA